MFEVGVKGAFIAQHRLIGGDWGKENLPHSHRYVAEVSMLASSLGRHGYVCDITLLERQLGRAIEHYSDRMLNDLVEFEDLNPSVERLAALMLERIAQDLPADGTTSMTVKLWEDDHAWASCTRVLGD